MLDFAIIGAPRAGTSALFNWLDYHPALQGSKPKETYFFMDSSHPLVKRQDKRGEPTLHTDDLSAFEQFFNDGSEADKHLRFEATTHHYYQKTALKMFSHFNTTPHVFFIIRQPARRIRSSFLFTKHNRGRIEPKFTFNRYVDALLDDNLSMLDKYYNSEVSLYIAKRELKLNKYLLWLKHWEERLGSGHVHPVVFERFVEESRCVAMRVCNVVGVDPSFYAEREISSENETTLVRSPRLQRLAHEMAKYIPDGQLKQTVKSLYRWAQIRNTSSSEASNTTRGIERLEEYFESWNTQLEEYSELDLSLWDCS